MISTNLYNEVLIKPCMEEGADELRIISGYATSAMAFHHLDELRQANIRKISLLLGMCPSDGISSSNHQGFQDIAKNYPKQFSCNYICNFPAVHSKIYIWYKDDELHKSFVGSANYTQNAFFNRQREVLAEICDAAVSDYYDLLDAESVCCSHPEVDASIRIYNDRDYYQRHLREDAVARDTGMASKTGGSIRKISLLSSRTRDVPGTAGLNWGQRPGREPNQAYIQLPPEVYRSDFFPARPQHFTVMTDDNKVLICTRAQKDEAGQAIETPHNNSLLGEYFRNRLGLENGAFVTKSDLERYGRTDVTFYKIDNENYYMDFSSNG
jgi:hypothetical protein